MFKKKTLQQHINEFRNKVDSRESTILSRIKSLEEQASAIQTQIKSQSAKIVDLELNGNNSGQIDDIKKSNRQLRLELEEIQESIEGYQNQLEHDPSLYAEDLEAIRQAGNDAISDRKKEMGELISKANDLESQIESLRKELEQIRNKWYILHQHNDYYTFSSILSYIDPRVTKLNSTEEEQFLNDWLSGSSSLENYFK